MSLKEAGKYIEKIICSKIYFRGAYEKINKILSTKYFVRANIVDILFFIKYAIINKKNVK